jgi:hypothetical protein
MKEKILQLIKNLRRGDDLEASKEEFFMIITEKIAYMLEEFSLRDLISIVDTYADHGTDLQKAQAMMISSFFNCIKISDTFLQYIKSTESYERPSSNGVFHLYDGVNSLRIQYDDMPSVLFYRILRSLRNAPVLYILWNEILHRLRTNSKTLLLASCDNEYFFTPQFFPGRKNFLNVKYDNPLVEQLDF